MKLKVTMEIEIIDFEDSDSVTDSIATSVLSQMEDNIENAEYDEPVYLKVKNMDISKL